MRLSILFLLLTTMSCTGPHRLNEASPVISMEKLQCMGNCPVYKIDIYENGTVLFHGKKHISPQGKYYSHLSQKKLDETINKFLENEFFSFDNSYRSKYIDLQGTYIYFSYMGREKKIMDYSAPPDNLKELEDIISKLAESLKWKKMKDQVKVSFIN